MINISENPFTVHSPDALDQVSPETIVDLFVKKHTRFSAINQQKHSFLWGSRGSGKSFILRYMEPQCQFIEAGGVEEFFSKNDPYVGVYTPCSKGEIDKEELNLLSNAEARVITEHLLNLSIAEEVTSVLSSQFPEDYFNIDDKVEFAERAANLFDTASIAASKNQADNYHNKSDSPLKWLNKLFEEEKRRVTHYLNKVPFSEDARYQGATSGYHDFLLPLISNVQNLLQQPNVPIYILLDDAFHLTKRQQQVVNTWIANRDQGTVCVKVSSSKERYETFSTVGRGRIEIPHDYTEVSIDEIYTRNDSNYAQKVREIANKRLELSEIPANNIEEFLPKNEFEQELLEEIKEQVAEEWVEEDEPGERSDFINRYANARLFQELADRKNRKSYAGFENLVHISSGRIRYFLDPCFLMVEELKSDGVDVDEMEEIPPRIQDKILREYSRDLLIGEPEKMKKDLKPERRSHLDKLITLVKSLGQLFYNRLHDKDSREPRIFSFTIREEIDEDSEVKSVLELGRAMQYFQKDTYSSKDGGGREDWYILNRRLAPQFKIDPTGFQGRIRLTQRQLEEGCNDPQEFVRRVLGDDERQSGLEDFN
ncbi:hypothetical protein [Haloferax sp. Atlit-12N]|uniref:ORC-CDC6 family AAA ATPase n=1 Tax=Haloferax sp. Atlit-12N TaxID=2077203 RepID=UPI0011E5F1AF|nr:hypothetical protein [Haloferax sp. Atlit-12N]